MINWKYLFAAILLCQPVLAAPARADSVYYFPNSPTCKAAIGENEGDKYYASHIREVDGASLTNLTVFRAATSRGFDNALLINGGNFSGWDFSEVGLRSVCFNGSDLSDTNFSGISDVGVGFVKSDLTNANFQNAEMPAVLFRDVKLTNVNARGADFRAGHFDGGWFEGGVAGWNLAGANMHGFTFDCGITVSDGCPVYQGGDPINARGADFTGATLHSFGLYNVDMTGARLDKTIIGPGQLTQLQAADFRGEIILRGGDRDIAITAEEAKTLLYENTKQEVTASNPSFDCSDARTKVEEEICGEYADGLRQLDREVAALYKRAKTVDPKVQISQRAWLKQRNKCNAEEYANDCIKQSYSERKGQLLAVFGETDWLKKGEEALFVDEVLTLPTAFAKTELYTKISPSLIGASMTEILVKRELDGLYSIEGSAVGANAHLCSLSAKHLYFDKESGWYIVASDGPLTPIFRIYDGQLEIFKNGKPDYKEYPDAGDFMSCGARASFSDTRHIAVDAETLTTIRKNLMAVR